MITSKECYIYDKCKKYQNNNCVLEDDGFCIKLFKLNHLFDEALMSDKQRIYTPLYPDKDGTDRDKFIKLKEIETNIESFDKWREFIHSLLYLWKW